MTGVRSYRLYRQLVFFGLLLFLISIPGQSRAQRYALQNYNTENGLVQSQALTMAQDPINRLWIGTFGGVSVFDGSEFKTYTRADGLISNTVTAIGFAPNGITWIGTADGICRFDGLQFKAYKLGVHSEASLINDIKVDNQNRVWLRSGNKIYIFKGDRFERVPTEGIITSLFLDEQRYVHLCYLQKGVFRFINNQWQSLTDNVPEGFCLSVCQSRYSGKMYVLTTTGLYLLNERSLQLLTKDLPGFDITTLATKIVVDQNEHIWIAVGNGLWFYDDTRGFVKLNATNGYTDEQTFSIFTDNTNNIWLGTNGSGIFKYSDSPFKIFDNTQIPFAKSIINIFERGNNLVLSTTYHGVFRFDEQRNTTTPVALPDFATSIISIYDDRDLGTYYATYRGLWNVKDGKAAKIKARAIPFITDWTTVQGQIWCTNGEGLCVIDKDSLRLVKAGPYKRLIAYDAQTIILGTQRGLLKYDLQTGATDSLKGLQMLRVQCMTGDTKRLYIGTDENGVVVYEYQSGRIYTISHDDGLSCNYVYNLLIDTDHMLWAGTGCGIDRIQCTETGTYQLKSYGKAEGLSGAESNERASYQDAAGNIWFGTTKGLYMYNKRKEKAYNSTPFVTLTNVQLFSKNIPSGKYSDSTIPYIRIPYKPVFDHNQNNLTFSFRAISLSSPERIQYRYRLEGADPNFIETKQTSVVYTSLPPGKYTFVVYASDENGNWTENAYRYTFTIKAIFYQETTFRIFTGLLLAALIAYIIYWYSRKKEARRQWEMRLREEEQNKVRQRTAEDFHDEIGNKITRINLLTMMAERKIAGQTELGDILSQIRNNTQSLYHGSKDIIWSLQCESNFLKEALLRIQQNASAILEDTGIRLHIEEEPPIRFDVKMPLDYSRNLILIFKEAINNAIKYAAADNIYLRFYEDIDSSVVLEMADDGKGYDPENSTGGNGLKNMHNRARAIKGKLSIISHAGQGTTIRLRMFKYSFKK